LPRLLASTLVTRALGLVLERLGFPTLRVAGARAE
jgi:hypothetical protein